jgi:hypothetical protein
MKKYIVCAAAFLFLACNNDHDEESVSQAKIQKLTIKDEMITNGNTVVTDQLDFKFEYNQNKLTKVWDPANYTEILTYENNLIREINISGYSYPMLSDHMPFTIKRKLSYDGNQRIIKSESLENTASYSYIAFEYPSSGLIIAKEYMQSPYDGVVRLAYKYLIYLNNNNVTKVEKWINTIPELMTEVTNYEYDQKINPNSLVDRNRILGLPRYSYNIFVLQDYSQISKNNVIKKQRIAFGGNGISYPDPKIEISYEYQNNDLPSSVYIKEGYQSSLLKVSANFGFN